jgi:hypothetical protein
MLFDHPEKAVGNLMNIYELSPVQHEVGKIIEGLLTLKHSEPTSAD